jgi:cytochrome c-type biogenesis protein CcmE
MKTYWKFAALIVVLLGTLVWLAVGGINENKTYYKTISEVQSMGGDAIGKRLRVAGDVEPGSIVRAGGQVRFVIHQDDQRLQVVYRGTDPLPDTLRDRAQALADGKLGSGGVFEADKIQAKCASKYEAKPGEGYQQQKPVYTTPTAARSASQP